MASSEGVLVIVLSATERLWGALDEYIGSDNTWPAALLGQTMVKNWPQSNHAHAVYTWFKLSEDSVSTLSELIIGGN